jgi:hypothetical protein
MDKEIEQNNSCFRLDYNILGISLDVIYSAAKHNDKWFPKVKELFHNKENIVELVDRSVIELIEVGIYKEINNIP